MSKYTSVLIFLIFCVFTEHAQFILSGAVLDASSDDPIPFAHIQIKDSIGVVSDLNGAFVFENLKQGKYALEVSFVGYKSFKKNIKVNKNNKYTRRM